MQQIRKLCANAESIVIYGAGAMANLAYLYLQECDLSYKIKYFVVTNLKENKPIKQGIPVLEWNTQKDKIQNELILIAVTPIVRSEIEETIKESGFTNYAKIDEKKLVDGLYENLYKEPVHNNKILFSNVRGLGYGCNPKYIAEKLLELDTEKKLDLVWVTDGTKYHLPERIRTVKYDSLEYYREIATSKIWIDNMRKEPDVKKREGQFYIQAWHGAAPIKRVEKDALDSLNSTYIETAKYDSAMADLFLSGSRFYTDLYRRAFWYDGEIMEEGLPRQDVFFHAEGMREKVLHKLAIKEDVLFVLYAPTFRKVFNAQAYELDFALIKKSLEERFGRKVVFGVSKHPLNLGNDYSFGYQEDCIDVCHYEDFEELLAAADILLSDYSGCMYDFSFTGRPIFLFQSDYKDYEADRNFYIPMEKLPYIRALSNEELAEKIRSFDEEKYRKELAAFMESMGNYDKGNASMKVAEWIMEKING